MANSRISRIAVCIIIFALAVCVVGCSSSNSSSSPEELGLVSVEVEAPDFTVPTMEGGEITLSDLQGMPVVLNCWAIECPPCRMELPYLDVVGKEYAGKVVIIAVDLQDDVSQLEQFFAGNEVSFIVALDKDAQVNIGYNTGYIPSTFFIDSSGVVRYMKVGAFTGEEQLRASIEELLLNYQANIK